MKKQQQHGGAGGCPDTRPPAAAAAAAGGGPGPGGGWRRRRPLSLLPFLSLRDYGFCMAALLLFCLGSLFYQLNGGPPHFLLDLRHYLGKRGRGLVAPRGWDGLGRPASLPPSRGQSRSPAAIWVAVPLVSAPLAEELGEAGAPRGCASAAPRRG